MALVLRKPALRPAQAPVCSVCIANYNGRETLDACLRSVVQQDCPFDVEIIVHDDASTDGSVEDLQQRYPQVELLIGAENAGFCVSNNRMVAAARGGFILLLNNDAELLPDALRCLHERALRQPDAILGLPQYSMPDGQLTDRGSLLDPFLNPIPNLDRSRSRVAMVMGACLWCPRSTWDELGGFPEWFETNAEDLYLCCLARLWGRPVEVLDRSGFRHWVGNTLGGGKVIAQTLRTSRRRRALSERNKTFAMIVTCPQPALLVLLPMHLLALFVEGLFISLAKRDLSLWRDIYWNCVWALWCQRKSLRAARRRAQAGRRVGVAEYLRPHRLFPHKLRMLLRYGVPRIDG